MNLKPNKKILTVIGICLLCSVLGYETGRHRAPAKVQVVTKTVTVDHDVVKTVTQVQKQVVYVQAEAKDVHRVVVVDKKPTGEVVTTTTVQDNSKIVASNTTDQIKNQDKSEDHVVYKDHEVTKTVINNVRPDWSVGAMAGYNFAGSDNLIPAAVLPPKAVVGVQLERRIIGPVYMGIWGVSSKVAGVEININF